MIRTRTSITAVCVAGFGALLFLSGCMKEALQGETDTETAAWNGRFAVTEQYEVTGGPREGMKGESQYTITLSKLPSDTVVVIERFANAYTVLAYVKGDSLFIERQQFPYYDEHVVLSGAGSMSRNELSLIYYSGGPAGQITCVCRAVKK